jgi:hypothetical protein
VAKPTEVDEKRIARALYSAGAPSDRPDHPARSPHAAKRNAGLRSDWTGNLAPASAGQALSEARRSFLKKRTKKRLTAAVRASRKARVRVQKFFASFFKKEDFLP